MTKSAFFRKSVFLALLMTASTAAPVGRAAEPLSLDQATDLSGNPSGNLNDIKPTDVIHWRVQGGDIYPSGKTVVLIQLTTEKGFSVYRDRLAFAPVGAESVTERVDYPSSTKTKDEISGEEKEIFPGGDFTIILKAPQGSGLKVLELDVSFIGCAGRICLYPYTERLKVPLVMRELEPAAAVNQAVVKRDEGAPVISSTQDDTEDFTTRWARKIQGGSFQFWLLLLAVFIGGILTNLTPCVYPMIPITIRLLSAQGGSPLRAACCYAGGILATYTSLGIFAGLSGSLFGSILSSPTVNLFFAAVMLVLGISMLGVFDFSFLQKMAPTVKKGKTSLMNAFIMGVGAGFVASPCTGPILAALIAYTAKERDILRATALLFTYSLGFALPYVFLGAAAGRASRLKISFKVQGVIKLVFAGIMVALGFYYLRVPARGFLLSIDRALGLQLLWQLVSRAGLALALVMLLSWWFLDWLKNSKVFSIVLAFVLGAGVFATFQKSDGPLEKTGFAKLDWLSTEAAGFKTAKERSGPILLDGWAEWCEACKKMEQTTFKDPEVIGKLKSGNWVTVRLDLTDSNDENDAIQAKYGFFGLPVLILLPPDGDLNKKKLISGYVDSKSLIKQLGEFEASFKR